MRGARSMSAMFTAIVTLGLVACGGSGTSTPSTTSTGRAGTSSTSHTRGTTSPASSAAAGGDASTLPGMPPVLDPRNIYAADRPNQLSPAVRRFRPLVYVPNSLSNTVDVIDPATYQIVEHFAVGALPQHVVPAWDLKTLYVTNDDGNSLTPIDPATGQPGTPIPVEDPYNMYFTPNGKYAIIVA